MAGPRPNTRNKSIATNITPGSSNLHNVEVVPEPVNTIYANAAPQTTMQPPRPVNVVFSSLQACLELNPNQNQQIPHTKRSPNPVAENTNVLGTPRQNPQEQQTNGILTSILTLLQQQAARVSNLEKYQEVIP
ncbi:hypothetical protein A2U01_0004781 [Trifolium medium]|uniref:Uncharacterized protein n=1 Tax=Trifolium medium TaxID=97028 RepID=A0A392M9K2_9FABA|nr:hypothetical protein [Trifolium medium]